MTWFVVIDLTFRNLDEDTLCFYVESPDLSELVKAEKDWVMLHTIGHHLGWDIDQWDTHSGILSLKDGREVFMLDYWEEDSSTKPHEKVLKNTLYNK